MGTGIDQKIKESEARRLADLAFKAIESGSYSSLSALATGIKLPGGKSMLNQNMKGTRPISPECAAIYCAGLRITLDQLSPRLAELATKLADHLPRPYTAGSTVTVLTARQPIALPPIVQQIAETAEAMNDTGRARLLERAEQLREQYPAAKSNHAK